MVLTFATFANEFQGDIIIENTTGGAITIAWPGCSLAGDALPTSLAAGQYIVIPFQIIGTTLADVICYYRAPAGDASFDVTAYGAVPNSSGAAAANVTAINAAIGALIAAGGGRLFFPGGVWYVNALLDFGTTAVPICVSGKGVGVSEIRQTAANTGVFNLLQSARDVCFTIQDLRLSHNNATALSSAAAVEIGNNVNSANDNAPNLIVQNVDVRCDSGSSKAFTYGFRCSNIKVGKWNGYSYTGTNANTGTGVKFQGYGGSSAGLKCIGHEMVNCFINLAETGIQVVDAMEGLMMTDMQMIGLVYGILADYCIHIGLHNSHINASVGISATGTGGGVDQMLVTGCLIYQQGVNFVGIQGDFSRGSITGNSFVAPAGDAGTKGVNLTAGVGMVVVGNSFYDQQSTYVTTAGDKGRISGNTVSTNVGAASSPWVDSGSGNHMGNAVGLTATITVAGGNPYEDFAFDISEGCFGSKINGVIPDVVDVQDYEARYVWSDGANSATNAQIRVFRPAGNTVAGTYRLSVVANPP